MKQWRRVLGWRPSGLEIVMGEIGLAAGSGWAAGLNLWSVALVMGIAGRASLTDTPDVLQRTDVLIAMAMLYVFEFFVDKIPFVDNAWDAISTIIRPVGAALLGIAVAQNGDASVVTSAATAGGLALTSHAAKATIRAFINLSPEPVSNSIASIGEDVTAIGMVSLALAYPKVALVFALVLGAIGVIIAVALWRFVRRLRRRWRERRAA